MSRDQQRYDPYYGDQALSNRITALEQQVQQLIIQVQSLQSVSDAARTTKPTNCPRCGGLGRIYVPSTASYVDCEFCRGVGY